jgi:hypothetical protein
VVMVAQAELVVQVLVAQAAPQELVEQQPE